MGRESIQSDSEAKEPERCPDTPRKTFISKLPVELLVEIFRDIQGSGRQLKDWHYISHVCHRWRHTAINTPTLWTRISSCSPEYTNLMLERSKNASLIIDMKTPSSASMNLVSSHVGRINTLILGLVWEVPETLRILLSPGQAFSQMETLELSSIHYVSALPSALVQSTRLRSLRLSNLTCDWRLLPLHLTSFILSFSNDRTTMPLRTLFDTLTKMACLRELWLYTSHPVIPQDEHIRQNTKIVLRHLQRLQIIESSTAPRRSRPYTPFLLSQLEAPSLKNLTIFVKLPKDKFTSSLDMVARLVSEGDFQASDAEELCIEEGTFRISGLGGSFDLYLRLSVHRTVSDDQGYLKTQQLARFAPMFPNLAHVHFDLPIGSLTFVRTFGSMPRLQTITVQEESGTLIDTLAEAFSHCFCYDTPTSHSSNGAHSFPALEAIYCKNIIWTHLHKEIIKEFCNALAQRSSHSPGLKAVYWIHSKGHDQWRGGIPDWGVKILEEGGIRAMLDTSPRRCICRKH